MLLERRVDGIPTAAPQMERDARIGELLRGPVRRSASIVFWEAGSRSSVPTTWRQPCSPPDIYSGWDIGASRRSWGQRRQVTAMRLKGYERALEEAQVPYDPALVESGNWMADEAYRATIRLLDRAPDITAIYAQNDLMALGVMSALYGRGLCS